MRGRLASLPERATYITHALPGIVVAISVVYVGIRAVRPWYQEFPLLIFGQVVIFLPVMVAAIRAALEKAPAALEDVAHSLGASKAGTLARVTLPLVLPGLLAGTALTMLAAVKELPVTLLLRPTGMDTLSTKIWDFSTVSDYAAVGPYAVAMLALAAIPTALLGTLSATRGQRP
jgi:iron(III) transport system permease protein